MFQRVRCMDGIVGQSRLGSVQVEKGKSVEL